MCIKYNSCIDHLWTKFELGRTDFNENKIQLTSYLKTKIESEVKLLISVLVARFYSERFIKKIESVSKNLYSNLNLANNINTFA